MCCKSCVAVCHRQQHPLAAASSSTGEQLQKQISYAVHDDWYWDELSDLIQHPAASQISPQGMQQLLQDMLDVVACHNRRQRPAFAETLLSHRSLDVHDANSISSGMFVAQCLDAAAVTALMDHGIAQDCSSCLQLVARLPAAIHLDHVHAEGLLHKALEQVAEHSQAGSRMQDLKCLLQLPAVQALPAETAGRQMQSAIEQELQLSVLKLLAVQLPAVQELSGDQVKVLMQAAWENQVSSVAGC